MVASHTHLDGEPADDVMYVRRFMTRARIRLACACMFMRVNVFLLMLFNTCNMCVERRSDVCVIELVAGLYHKIWSK